MDDRERFYRWEGDDLILTVRVQPRSSMDEVVGVRAGALKVRITAPPVEGKANDYLVRYVAGLFAVPKSRVSLVSGASGRDKRLRIQSPVRLPADISRATDASVPGPRRDRRGRR